jgi:hypothetical protein
MRRELTTTVSEVGDRAANNRAAMLHRVILAGVSTCLLVTATYLSQSSNAHAQTAPASTNFCWIDAATGNPAPLGPPLWDPNPTVKSMGNNPDANHVYYGGHTFVRVPCPPPAGASESAQSGPTAQPAPDTGSSLTTFGFGIGGFGRGQIVIKTAAVAPENGWTP